VLRRLVVALVTVVPLVVLAATGPAVAAGSASGASYPPNAPSQETTIAPGVVYGGSATGASTISVCAASVTVSQRVVQGQPFLIKVCTFLPGSLVKAYVLPPSSPKVAAGTSAADGDGAVVAGPFRLMSPGHYQFSFLGAASNVSGLGAGGIGTRGMSRVLAAQRKTVQVDLTVAGSDPVTLPRTGGTGEGPTSLVWGIALLGAGSLLVVAAVSRRRSRRSLATAAHSA
jgi:hypothetical protein